MTPPTPGMHAALALAARGMHVFPVRPGSKRPMVRWGTQATTDPGVIAGWWSRWPAASIAVACKPSRLTVIDIDGPTGRASWDALLAAHGHVPTASVITGRDDGGIHYWYRAPALDPPPNSCGEPDRGVAPGIDIRGAGDSAGGMVLAPPSWHPSGRRYQWRDRLPLADLPAWLHLLASARPTTGGQEGCGDPDAARRRWTARHQHRDGPQTRAGRWAAAVLTGEAADITGMPPDSGRNAALNGAAYKLGRLVAGGLLDADDVRQALTDAAAACGLPEREATRTIASGMAAGARSPRTVVAAG